ncbi:MAG: adenylosuccinate synthase [Candidatus Scalindua sp.]|jgi:adenylosuccinate synthase|nr:adenylosuccinate synthase [Candidatus Scalindua sp.]
MTNTCVIGLQWGDEGKGKIIDILAKDYDIIVRYQGGGNAGHTLIIGDEKFIFHLIPSGILHPDKKCVIGNGIVFDPRLFLDEVAGLSKRNISVNGNLFVSDRAHVVFPYHKKLDLLIEKQKGNSMIGTTGRGIGPCYTDKVARDGIRVAELLHKEHFKEKLKKTVEEKNRLFVDLYKDEPVSWEEIYEEYCVYAEKISPFVCDTVDLMAKAIDDNKKILFEGAQGALLDVDFGTYPYTTSSNASAGGVSPGIGVSPKQIHDIIGITKAYATRVGSGPFPTEIDGEQGEHIRKKGGEFGSTTGRPRRCGWFDAVAIRHSVRISGVDSLIVTKLDVLDDQETIRICTGYKNDKKVYHNFPADLDVLENCEPIYEEVSGWMEDTSNVRDVKDLPGKAMDYIRTIEEIIGLKVKMVSVGPERLQIISI